MTGQHGIAFEGSVGKKMVFAAITLIPPADNKGAGYATAWQGTYPAPNHSFANYYPGMITTNTVMVPLAADGTFKIYLSHPAQVFADLWGYVT